MIHRIDKEILKKLLTHEDQRFSDIKPLGVESNAFTYRLKKMIAEGIVGKRKNGRYYLTAQGRFYTDRLNLGRFTERRLPKPLLLLVVRNEKGEWLLYQRFIHPLKDYIGLPHTNLHAGHSLVELAQHRMQEVMGLSTTLAHRGSCYLTVYKNGELEGYNHVDILENTGPVTGTLREEPESGMGRYFWQKDPDFNDPKYIPSLKIFEKHFEQGNFPFFEEITLNL